MKINKLPNLLFILSVVLYLFSLIPKAYCTNGDCGGMFSGLAIVFSGFFGVFLGGACFTWLANPLIFSSWILFRKSKMSFFTSLMALFIGLSFLLFDEIMINEAGHFGKITGYSIGYYLWIASFILMNIANLLVYKNDKS